MSWQGELTTIVRVLINDIDPAAYSFSDHRLETAILAAARLMMMSVEFTNDYTVIVDQCSLSPDPTEADTLDAAFITLSCLKTACIILGGEIRSGAGNAISIKDGPSAIDLRGVGQSINVVRKDVCEEYERLLLEYKTTGGVDGGGIGQAILGPYSPGSYLISRNAPDHRSGGFFNN